MDKEKIQEGVRLILEGIGEDIHREGLVETPDRIAKMNVFFHDHVIIGNMEPFL